jgi:hypothetical protein
MTKRGMIASTQHNFCIRLMKNKLWTMELFKTAPFILLSLCPYSLLLCSYYHKKYSPKNQLFTNNNDR